MDIYVLDENFNKIECVDHYQSAIWNTKFFDAGDFELYLSANAKNFNLFTIGRYLVRDTDIKDGCFYNVMIIEKIEIKSDIESGNFMTVTGKDLKGLTARRIIDYQTNFNCTVEKAFRQLMNEHIITPEVEERKIDNVVLGEEKGFTEMIEQQVTGDNLMEYLVSTLTSFNIGWTAHVNKNKKIEFNLVKGTDRSVQQSTNDRVVFSLANDNLISSDYTIDYTSYKNTAMVLGEGEGKARKGATVGTATGLDRFELYVDKRDVSSNDGELTDSEYTAALEQSGVEALAEYKKVENFENEIEKNVMFKLGQDYYLGDIVTVETDYGLVTNPRIIGIIDSVSSEGESTVPTFSTYE